MIRFTRDFHTVGQGAFYSENINIDNKRDFRMIYDCGSASLSESGLTKRIKSDLAGDMNVDILFISHFDKDHINGVHHLKPKTVVIPFLSNDQISILKLYNNIFGETYEVGLAENPMEFFENAPRVIRVLPRNNDSYNQKHLDYKKEQEKTEDIEFYIDQDNNHVKQDILLKSNSCISFLCKWKHIWEYIPYNPNWNKYAERFKLAIQKEGLDWNKLTDPLNADYIEKHFSVIKEIYNKLKSKNRHSLVVYSNATVNVCIPVCCYRDCLPLRCSVLSGCIYFGDATIESEWINSFYMYLEYTGRLHKVGTLQVPHHGSHLSNGQSIISFEHPFGNLVVCIISVGEFNHFGHPSLHIVQELRRKGGIVFMVTEASSSLFYTEGVIR